MPPTAQPSPSNLAPAAEGLRVLQEQDLRLAALSDRLWRFPDLKVEPLGRIRPGMGWDAGLDRDPLIQPETRTELRAAIAQRIYRPVVGSKKTVAMPDAAIALNASAVEVEAETPAETAFLKEWKRKYG